MVLNSTICESCSDRRCLIACPASLFVETSNGSMIFNYENCFECGTCYLVCNQEGAITWNYPTGGYGVDFLHS
uniref:ferredoxin family protein n=1 Tax=Acidithrix sp. C25 TaxID=1671482 RepID=UPI0032DF3979